jgi:hypothetical protein
VLFACSPPGGHHQPPADSGPWSKRLGGAGDDTGHALAVDSSGNVFVAGTVTGNADLNGNGSSSEGFPETASLVSNGFNDIFLVKFNSSGTFQWAKRLGGTFLDDGYGVAVDANGNVFVTGTVLGAADLNGDGSITDTLPETPGAAHGSYDIFLAKFNSSGTFQWATRLGGVNDDFGYAVAADSNGSVFVAGVINDNADLDGDGAIAGGGGLPETAQHAGINDAFLVKFDSAGSYKWAYRLWSVGAAGGYAVAARSGGNVAVAGVINGDAYLDGTDSTLTTARGNNDGFVSVFSNNDTGDFQWAKVMGGAADNDEAHGVAIAGSGRIYVTGFVNGDADLDGNDAVAAGLPETSAAPYGGEDVFISVFNADGFAAFWTQRLGGSAGDRGLAVTHDSSDNLIVTGFVKGDADLDADGAVAAGLPETPSLTYGLEDVFSAKFDSSGTFLWSTRLGGISDDQGSGVGADSGGKIYLTGSVQGDADLDGNDAVAAGLPETVSGVYGSNDVFVSKLTGQ